MFRKKFRFTPHVLNEICETIGRLPAETGGILGCRGASRTIDHYYFDRFAHTTGSTYSPDTATFNNVIAKWNDSGVRSVGFVHSHPKGHIAPSAEDMGYAKKIMEVLT